MTAEGAEVHRGVHEPINDLTSEYSRIGTPCGSRASHRLPRGVPSESGATTAIEDGGQGKGCLRCWRGFEFDFGNHFCSHRQGAGEEWA